MYLSAKQCTIGCPADFAGLSGSSPQIINENPGNLYNYKLIAFVKRVWDTFLTGNLQFQYSFILLNGLIQSYSQG